MKREINNKLFNFYIIIVSLYVFRGVLISLGIEKIIYVLSSILLICSFIFSDKKNIKKSPFVLLFILVGIVNLITSIINNSSNIIISISGFISLYFNFITCYYLINAIDNKNRSIYLSKFFRIILILGVISSIIGLYQRFIDPSIFGFANNDIYGNAEALATGKYTIRATALLGSAQNYGIFVGMAFAIGVFIKKKNIIDYIMIAVVFVGILISGSRSASICVLISEGYFLFDKIKSLHVQGKLNKRVLIFPLLACIVLVSIFLIFKSQFLASKTVSRLVDFDISPAVNIYKKSLDNMSFRDYILGKGLGYRDWVVNQLVGENSYSSFFGEKYISAESCFLMALLQGGILRLLVFISLLVYSIIKSYKESNKILFVALVCLFVNLLHTPSFSGMAISFIFYFVILMPHCKNVDKIGEMVK